jgi:3-isopropylmalate dehydrogenase
VERSESAQNARLATRRALWQQEIRGGQSVNSLIFRFAGPGKSRFDVPFGRDDPGPAQHFYLMKNLRIAVLPGDGIGPEVMAVALQILAKSAAQHGFSVEHSTWDVGGIAIDRHGSPLPAATLDACRAADAILFGSVGGPKWEKLPPKDQPERGALLPLRKEFKLFANVRPGLLYPELVDASPLKRERIPQGIDIVCVRELTGGVYFGQPKLTRTLPDGDIEAIDTMVYKKSEIERITEVACRAALTRGKRLCSVDKANVLETSVLWRKTVTDYVAKNFPAIALSHLYADNAAMQLARDPNQFDVIVTENMFGDILSDEMAVVCGSLGMLASASLGTGQNRHGLPFGLYEPAGGTAPDLAGKNLANPCAQILSVALMLRHSFGLEAPAAAIEKTVRATVTGGTRTGDIAFGQASVGTKEMGAAILQRL